MRDPLSGRRRSGVTYAIVTGGAKVALLAGKGAGEAAKLDRPVPVPHEPPICEGRQDLRQ
jgi:hypothetical protein